MALNDPDGRSGPFFLPPEETTKAVIGGLGSAWGWLRDKVVKRRISSGASVGAEAAVKIDLGQRRAEVELRVEDANPEPADWARDYSEALKRNAVAKAEQDNYAAQKAAAAQRAEAAARQPRIGMVPMPPWGRKGRMKPTRGAPVKPTKPLAKSQARTARVDWLPC